MRIHTIYPQAFRLALLATLTLLGLSGCDGPLSSDSQGGSPSPLDAQAGMDRFNNYDFSQGNLFSSGNILDLGLEGQGFFVLKKATQYVYFRRPAVFYQNAEGYLFL